MLLIITLHFPGQRAVYIDKHFEGRLGLRELGELTRRLKLIRNVSDAEIVGTPFEVVIRSNARGPEEEANTRRRIDEVFTEFVERATV